MEALGIQVLVKMTKTSKCYCDSCGEKVDEDKARIFMVTDLDDRRSTWFHYHRECLNSLSEFKDVVRRGAKDEV